jgi:hypothetical protein
VSTPVPANSPFAALAAKTRFESIFCWAGVNDSLIAAIAAIWAAAWSDTPESCCANTWADRQTATPMTPTHDTATRLTTDKAFFIVISPGSLPVEQMIERSSRRETDS